MRQALSLIVVLAVLALVGFAPARAEEAERGAGPLLWVVEGDTPSYLFGSLHVPDKRLTKLPATVARALQACDVFVSEAPLDATSQLKIQMGKRVPAGGTLAKYVGAALYARVKKLLPPALPETVYRQLAPNAVATLLEVRNYVAAAMQGVPSQTGVLYLQALRAAKETEALESIEEQSAVGGKLTQAEWTRVLEAVVTRVEAEEAAGKDSTARLLEAYLAGDLDRVVRHARRPAGDDETLNAKRERTLFQQRLGVMAERLRTRLREEPNKVHFVTVSAALLGGRGGLVERLTKQGLRIRRLRAGEALPRRKQPASGG